MTINLLEAIRLRQKKQTEFNYGILTADRYVSTLRDCVGIDACYKFAATRQTSFDDVLRKAAQTLVYSNEDMVVEEGGIEYHKQAEGASPKVFDNIELPKNTLMVFRHVLTTPRKDRDGDVLRTQGAVVDPKMLLLWQHVHTLPIGKMLAVMEHNSKRLSIISCIVDMNDLSHDAAVMIDSKMGRFSHGFRALEFDEMKAEGGSPGGFDVRKFEIMEASLVSVPSNVDAEVQDVLLSLVEGGKLTSPLMKATGKSIREHRNPRVPITVDLKMLINGKEVTSEIQSRDGSGETAGTGQGEKCSCGTSEEANGNGQEKDGAQNKENLNNDMHSVDGYCPKCGAAMGKDGKCPKCGYGTVNPAGARSFIDGEKAGRMLSDKNANCISGCCDDMEDLLEKGYDMNKGGKAILKGCHSRLKALLDENTMTQSKPEETPAEDTSGAVEKMTIEDAITLVLTDASLQQRQLLIDTLKVLEEADALSRKAQSFSSFIEKCGDGDAIGFGKLDRK